MERIGRLNELAKRRGQTMAEMAVAWLLKEEAITSVLVGASRPSQIIDNIKAIDNTEFSEEELREIDAESIF
jgi:L-glyceraldehyde 3-phosphate reductase